MSPRVYGITLALTAKATQCDHDFLRADHPDGPMVPPRVLYGRPFGADAGRLQQQSVYLIGLICAAARRCARCSPEHSRGTNCRPLGPCFISSRSGSAAYRSRSEKPMLAAIYDRRFTLR